MPDWRTCSVEWEDTRQASLLVQFGSHGWVRAGWCWSVIPLVEFEEERKERLRRLAKERVQDLLRKPQDFGVNQGSGSDRTIYSGPRGGRYTRAETKDGRPYRRYF